MTHILPADVLIDGDEAGLAAPSFATLISDGVCWKCRAPTPMSAIWLPSFTEIDHEGGEHETTLHTAVLRYISALSASVWDKWRAVAPWVRYAHTEGSGGAYFANHCVACDTVQGDWFVFGVDGPFFPQSSAEIERIQFVRGLGAFHGCATAAVSAWMNKVELESF